MKIQGAAKKRSTKTAISRERLDVLLRNFPIITQKVLRYEICEVLLSYLEIANNRSIKVRHGIMIMMLLLMMMMIIIIIIIMVMVNVIRFCS